MYSRLVIDSMVPVLIPCLAFMIWYVANLIKWEQVDESGPPNPEPDPEPQPPVVPDGEVADNRDFYASYARMLDAVDSQMMDEEIAQFQKEYPLTPAN